MGPRFGRELAFLASNQLLEVLVSRRRGTEPPVCLNNSRGSPYDGQAKGLSEHLSGPADQVQGKRHRRQRVQGAPANGKGKLSSVPGPPVALLAAGCPHLTLVCIP